MMYIPRLDKVDGHRSWKKTQYDATAARASAGPDTGDAAACGIYQGQYRVTLASLIGAEIALGDLQQANDELETALQDSRNDNARLRKVLEVGGDD